VNSAVALLALLVLSFPAFAKAAVGLAYEAPEGCPSQQEFVAAVAARGADFDGVGPAGAHRVMVVAIRKQDGGFAGAFQVRDGETATNKREVRGPGCAEVVEALAVVTAIALRPEIAAAPDPSTAAAPPVKALPPAVREPAPVPKDDRLHASTFYYHPAHESVAVGAGKVSFDLVRTLNLYGGVVTGAAPSTLMPRFDLTTTAANFVTLPDGSQRILGLVLQFRASLLGPATYRSIDTKTDLYGASFGFQICPTPHYDAAGLVLLLCMEYGVGAMNLRTAGSDGVRIQSKNVGFGMAGLGVEVQYNLGSLFHVGAKVGWNGYLGEWTAERADGNRIFGSSVSSGYVLVGVGFRF
jgi:hypothetical protein